MNYPIPKPSYPMAVRMLGAGVTLGLIGLGLVAFSVFSMIDSPVVAGAFALVIELGAIAEAIALIRGNKLAMAGLGISLTVSVIYNYTRAAAAAATLPEPISQAELLALAIGPLSATLFLALALGRELAQHEQRVTQWAQAAAAYQTERERETQRLELASRERIERARMRVEAKAQQARTSIEVPPLKVELPKYSYSDFVEFHRSNGKHHTNAALAARFNVSTRTITDWRARLEQEQAGQRIQEN